MSDDMTYQSVMTLAQAQARIAELEARLDAVPDYADYCYECLSKKDELPMVFDDWCAFVGIAAVRP